jgi:hypothetical protein
MIFSALKQCDFLLTVNSGLKAKAGGTTNPLYYMKVNLDNMEIIVHESSSWLPVCDYRSFWAFYVSGVLVISILRGRKRNGRDKRLFAP